MTCLENGARAGPRAILDLNPIVGEMRAGSRRFWTGREEKILRAHYPVGGLPGCLEVLPGRSATSIYQRAGMLGLKAPVTLAMNGPRQRWTSSEALDDVIRRAYPGATTKGAMNRLAQTIGRPPWWVGRRAAALGLVAPRFKAPKWSAEEDAILSEHHSLGLKAIWRRLKAAGYHRTETAIGVRLKRRHLSRAVDSDEFTARGLADVMGVDGKVVTRWIEKGWLKGRERPEGWSIRPADVRSFVVANAAAVDIRKVDKFWFIDLLAGTA